MENRDDFYSRSERHKNEARKYALSVAVKFFPNIPDFRNIEIPIAFGQRWAKSVERVLGRLIENHGETARWVAWVAVRHFHFSKLDAADWISRMISDSGDSVNDRYINDSFSRMATPDGYADLEGWANTAFNSFSELSKPLQLLEGSPLNDYPPDDAMLEALGLMWFLDAERMWREGDAHYMDVLFESSDAFLYANGLFMWAAGNETAKEESQADGIRELTKKAAAARHAENHQIAARIQDWYRENRTRYRSMDAAAEAVSRIEPVAFKTARKHIGIAAKNLPSTRKE